ncbi:putative glutamine amidotransferase [Clostridium saccharoperbutylacetonicum]|uniref:Glutamine amidotransferase n=1 Tax=Clostridium saccharoperbutylacetonicum N1-4(HMT) TaxID=931276 RepID=M1MK72_9CLOT|nr:gamma-glutamyl-gamma-aminobutyrate hydrolase family protein [Clostridium saccharoperbutylacetonicum]AGF55211.1 glutamine amidotransferase [Clostridium saccharoperbutylacetonicum N1-4(HMT)]NRT64078.1 putative glutamine amidotransferase [Clostridium saccharoperbutylacetonicum]NSB27445.1 putative glutamine amidotransferase [Clostridium saccharoperbutylacetonicum]NSB40934.1 putative glutamine amidotransferase [Clostridium saccharoperbutylacetonicum]
MKPIIGLALSSRVKPKKVYSVINNDYIKAVQKAGGIPVLIPFSDNLENIKVYTNKIQGIIFTGGEDISPLFYNEEPIKEVQCIIEKRDIFELELFKEVYKKQIPILGVCRGLQLINVALGGSLYQDINVQIHNSNGHLPKYALRSNLYHSVKIEKGSELFVIFKTEDLKVNSFHHQSIKKLGKDLRVTAHSSDGVIEGIESLKEKFLVGVQWHPENLVERHSEFLKLFQALIDNAREI